MSIFDEQISRKPDHYPWAEKFITAMHDGHWTEKEFDFANDVHDFHVVLNDTRREMTIRTLSAVGQVEIAVKKFWAKLGDNLPHPSLTDLGYVMANIEVIHNNAYERLLKVLGLEDVFEENLKLDFIEGRVAYLRKYTHKFYKNSKKQYLYALILFTLFVENVSLMSQFYIMNWMYRVWRVLKQVDQQVAYTRNEEAIHALCGMKIINEIRNEHPELFDEELEERIAHEAIQAFEAESKIVDWMVNGTVEFGPEGEGLSADILKEFIKNRINISLEGIGFKPVFDIDKNKIKHTIWFDEQLEGNISTDFFDQRPTEYTKKGQAFTAENIF